MEQKNYELLSGDELAIKDFCSVIKTHGIIQINQMLGISAKGIQSVYLSQVEAIKLRNFLNKVYGKEATQ